ncbi:GntR family transcriptional regulator [Cohaesibacter celericrescens]|uniref:GntR family transcriptional regulator n=1 Tax=Cohaesibacter celericrescens TaxID=2067669 RepID=A0A2N5XSZ7_9HYPH|nr:GntR family transcriptional regulator [Cohaesibacter celericrescens]PLW77538.1 GntR family transcriptional regulator [Cohaesibacter celericrescens]
MNVEDFLRPGSWLSKKSGPLYRQLSMRLERGISMGLLLPNTSLPAERDIADLTALSRVTVRKAIQELANKGVVEQRHGSGSFVKDRPSKVEQSLTHLTSFSEDMLARGYQTSAIWLERTIRRPSPDEVLTLGVSAGASVACLDRLREANGLPMAIERAVLPVDVLPNPDDVSSSLYEVLGRNGMRPVRAVQKISAINLEIREAELLGVDEGMAGLSIQRISYLDNGRAIELTKSTYRGDAYDFVAELRFSN